MDELRIKIYVWFIYGGEQKFKNEFPLSSNRSCIYKKVKSGITVYDAIMEVKSNFNLHDNAQRNKAKKHKQ